MENEYPTFTPIIQMPLTTGYPGSFFIGRANDSRSIIFVMLGNNSLPIKSGERKENLSNPLITKVSMSLIKKRDSRKCNKLYK